MPRVYDGICAVCPFYLQSNKKSITCEGITEHCSTALQFDSEEARNQHRRIFCDSQTNYKKCEVFKVLDEKYDE